MARLGAGSVSPNPMVGAVVVAQNRIIGEGLHHRYGEAHAEVNAVSSISPDDRTLLPQSTLYCSLEPCFHFGKTPPCVNLILREKIPRVVISNMDPNPLVAGKSVEKLTQAGVEVKIGVLEKQGLWLNRIFFHWISTGKPYVILKWAQSADGFIGRQNERTALSGAPAQRLLHRWRGETAAILVGSQTTFIDNPRLDTRYFPGAPPLRITFDRTNQLPGHYFMLDDTVPTWIYGNTRTSTGHQTEFLDEASTPENILSRLALHKKTSLLVEGGAETLSRWLLSGLWNEIRVIYTPKILGSGVSAPNVPPGAQLVQTEKLGNDEIKYYVNRK